NGEIAGKFNDIDTEINLVHQDAQKALNQAGDAVSQVAHFSETIDGFTQTVANIDGRVTNIRHDVDGITQTVTDQTGRIATVEQSVNGLRTTVAGKASQSEVTQLSNAVNTKVTSSQVNALIKKDKTIKDTRDKNETPKWYYDNYSQETVREFKQLNTMGISGEGTFGVLETIIQWKN